MTDASSSVPEASDASFSGARTWSREARPVLLYGGTVVTMDDAGTVLRRGEVILQGGRIAAIGRALTAHPGTELVDATDCLVVPGLIQGHVHLGQTFFRGLAEDRRLLAWLRDRIWPLEAAHDEESAYWCTLLGAAECLLGGTTTIQDIGIGPGAGGLLRAIRDARLRGFAGLCLMDRGGGLPEGLCNDTDDVLAQAEALGDRYDGSHDGRLGYAVNPRFVLSCSDELWRGAVDLASRRDWPIHTHALEQRDETEAVRAAKGGRDEIDYFDDLGVLDRDLRIAHGVWLHDDHLKRVDRERFSVVHCPGSNLKLGSGIADLLRLRRAGVRTGIGCDGAACNNHFDAFEEVRLAALLQKLEHGPDAFSGRDALRLATSAGAAALGLEDRVGSLEVGKEADVVLLRADAPELFAPAADVHDVIAFSASRAHVRDVYVAGERLVENGQLTHLDLGEIMTEAEKVYRRVLESVELS